MKNKIELDSTINIVLYSVVLSSFLSIITNIFNKKVNTIITSIVLFILGVLFSLQCVFYSIFKIYFTFSNLPLSPIFFTIFSLFYFYIYFFIYFILIYFGLFWFILFWFIYLSFVRKN